MKKEDKEDLKQPGTGVPYSFKNRNPSLFQEREQQTVIFKFDVDDRDIEAEQDDKRQQDTGGHRDRFYALQCSNET
ncbi:hypothetical protein [Paenibacillus sp. oral taxon 786]|uniref:hypothetical protein n=1 Tax=Paenibacillus sp. oral taxon 786 TaxID=652715 RepID=UPI000567883F|nr:hypothetical protein [Paenibacillus sp. oral taxon 786]